MERPAGFRGFAEVVELDLPLIAALKHTQPYDYIHYNSIKSDYFKLINAFLKKLQCNKVIIRNTFGYTSF